MLSANSQKLHQAKYSCSFRLAIYISTIVSLASTLNCTDPLWLHIQHCRYVRRCVRIFVRVLELTTNMSLPVAHEDDEAY